MNIRIGPARLVQIRGRLFCGGHGRAHSYSADLIYCNNLIRILGDIPLMVGKDAFRKVPIMTNAVECKILIVIYPHPLVVQAHYLITFFNLSP